jgi:hypothetical protein
VADFRVRATVEPIVAVIALARKLRTQTMAQMPILGELPDLPPPHRMWLRLKIAGTNRLQAQTRSVRKPNQSEPLQHDLWHKVDHQSDKCKLRCTG